jgi:hypothetical protein
MPISETVMSILQMHSPPIADLAYGQGDEMSFEGSMSLTSDLHSAYYDTGWAERLASCLGVQAAYDQLNGVPEQLIFLSEMILNSAATGHTQGLRQHALELKAMASRFGSVPLAFAALGVAHDEGKPSQAVLIELLRLSHTVSGEMRGHLSVLERQCWAH